MKSTRTTRIPSDRFCMTWSRAPPMQGASQQWSQYRAPREEAARYSRPVPMDRVPPARAAAAFRELHRVSANRPACPVAQMQCKLRLKNRGHYLLWGRYPWAACSRSFME
jgi:hypothetical protein